MNRNNMAVLLCDPEQRKTGHRAGGHKSGEAAVLRHITPLRSLFSAVISVFIVVISRFPPLKPRPGLRSHRLIVCLVLALQRVCSVREEALRINWDAFFSPTQQCWRMRRVNLLPCRVGCCRAGWALIAAGFSLLMEVDAGGDATHVFPSLNPPDCCFWIFFWYLMFFFFFFSCFQDDLAIFLAAGFHHHNIKRSR